MMDSRQIQIFVQARICTRLVVYTKKDRSSKEVCYLQIFFKERSYFFILLSVIRLLQNYGSVVVSPDTVPVLTVAIPPVVYTR